MTPKPLRFRARHFQAGDGDVRALIAMLAQHQFVIHLVDMVARQDDHVFRAMAFDDVDVLEHRIGSAFVPLRFGDALRGGQDVEAFVALGPQEVPALLQMADQRMGLVLGGDADAADAGIDRVGQRKIDDARLAAEIDRRLGAPSRSVRPAGCRVRRPGHRPWRHAPAAVHADPAISVLPCARRALS